MPLVDSCALGGRDDQRHHHGQADQVEHAGDEGADDDQGALPGRRQRRISRDRARPLAEALAPAGRVAAGRLAAAACGALARLVRITRAAAGSSRSACPPRRGSRPAHATRLSRRADQRGRGSSRSGRPQQRLAELAPARPGEAAHLLGRQVRPGDVHPRAAAQEAAPQDAAHGHPVRLPGAHDDRVVRRRRGVNPAALGADEQVAVLAAAMGELGAERAVAPPPARSSTPARHQHVVGAGPAGQAEAVAVVGPRRPEVAGVAQPARQLQVRRQPPEAEDEVGPGLALPAQRAARASPGAARRRRRGRPRSRRPSASASGDGPVARERDAAASAPRRSAARSAASARSASQTARAWPSGRLSTTISRTSSAAQLAAARSARRHASTRASRRGAVAGADADCHPRHRLTRRQMARSASKRPQLSQATASRRRSPGRCRRPKRRHDRSLVATLGRNRTAVVRGARACRRQVDAP